MVSQTILACCAVDQIDDENHNADGHVTDEAGIVPQFCVRFQTYGFENEDQVEEYGQEQREFEVHHENEPNSDHKSFHDQTVVMVLTHFPFEFLFLFAVSSRKFLSVLTEVFWLNYFQYEVYNHQNYSQWELYQTYRRNESSHIFNSIQYFESKTDGNYVPTKHQTSESILACESFGEYANLFPFTEVKHFQG